ncbi:hypothetical protein, partial [Enterobacter hormaechei]
VLGMWLRQSEGRRAPHPPPTHPTHFFTKPKKISLTNKNYKQKLKKKKQNKKNKTQNNNH